jgi:two-component system, OmpR family, response regulator
MAPPKILLVDDNQELLKLLSRLVEEAGYEALPASKGRLALDLARAEHPAAAVLDILLPDMIGHQLAELISKETKTPIIFMTGVFKGGKQAQEAKSKYGCVAYFEKPFDAQKLIQTLNGIAKPEAPTGAPDSIEDAFDVELDIDVVEELPVSEMELTGVIKVTGGDSISAVLKGEPLHAAATTANQGRVRNPAPGRIMTPGPVPVQDPKSRRGPLRDNLPALMNAFYLSQEGGELGVQRNKVKKIVYFEKGQPVFAQSNVVSDRFGQFLVRVGKITQEHLHVATMTAEARKCRTGDVLAEMGLLKETERLYYVGQHVKAIIYSIFAWEDGIYSVSFQNRARTEPIKLDVHPANLILRGIKKLYRPERLRRLLFPEDRLVPSLQPAYPLQDIELEKWEAQLLPQIDGSRTVAELLGLAGRPEQMVYGILYGLVALTVLEKRS